MKEVTSLSDAVDLLDAQVSCGTYIVNQLAAQGGKGMQQCSTIHNVDGAVSMAANGSPLASTSGQ